MSPLYGKIFSTSSSILLFFFLFITMAGSSIRGVGARGRAYTSDEDVILSQSWVNITQDPLVGKDQSGTQFWDRVLGTFKSILCTPTDRTAGSLASRFSAISKSVALFIAKLGSVTNRAASGTTEEDKLREARLEYMQSSGKAFKFDECYELLKDQPKFSLRITHVFNSVRSSQSGEAGSTVRSPRMQDWTTDIPTDVESPTPLSRSPDRKAEKKKRKKLAESSEYAEMVESNKYFNSFYKDALDQRNITTIKKIAIKEKDHEFKKQSEDDRVMSMDLSVLSETQRMYFMSRHNDIMRSRGFI